MNFHNFISEKLFANEGSKKSISRPIVKIAIGGIALGITVMILSLAIVTGFQNEIKNKVIGFGSHVSIAKFDNNVSYEPQPIPQKQDFIEDLKKNPAIKHIQVFATKNGILKTNTENEGVVLKGIDTDYDWTFIEGNLITGKRISFNDTAASKDILVSKTISDKLNLKKGDKLLVYFVTKKKANDSTDFVEFEQRVRDFKICGIYETGFEDLDAQAVFVDIKQIKKLNYWEQDLVGGFEIQLKDLGKLDEVSTQINESLSYELTAQGIKESNPGIFGWLDLMDSNAIIIITLMVIVAAINMISALLILILEKTNSIGLLKALGASNQSVRSIFLNLAFKLIAKGLLYGNIIGISICFIQMKWKILTLQKETYYLDHVPINFDILHIALLNAGTIVVCMVFMLLPTLVISKITPVKALRFN